MKQRTKPDERIIQTIDAETGKPVPTPRRRIDLSTLKDVRIELAHLYRKVDAGEIESSDGSRRAYVLKTIGDLIEMAELEKRIEQLEERHAAQALPRPALN